KLEFVYFFFQAEDGIRDFHVTGVQTCALPICLADKSLILQATLTHCETMSTPQNKKERISIGSLGPAEIGDADTENTYVFEAQRSEERRVGKECRARCGQEHEKRKGIEEENEK